MCFAVLVAVLTWAHPQDRAELTRTWRGLTRDLPPSPPSDAEGGNRFYFLFPRRKGAGGIGPAAKTETTAE